MGFTKSDINKLNLNHLNFLILLYEDLMWFHEWNINYNNSFNLALKNGVKILCYDCKLSDEEIRINNQINYKRGRDFPGSNFNSRFRVGN